MTIGTFLVLACARPTTSPEVIAFLEKLAQEGDLIAAKEITGEVPVDPADSLWQEASELIVPLVSQVAVPPRARAFKKSELSVRALYTQEEIGFRLEWADATVDVSEAGTERFRDAVAIGIPLHYGAETALPYIGMGNQGRPINIWHWKASWESGGSLPHPAPSAKELEAVSDTDIVNFRTGEDAGNPISLATHLSPVENTLAEGFGSLTSVPDENLQGKGSWHEGTWNVVIKRPLKTSRDRGALLNKKTGLVPVTFAVWDGSRSERNGMKGLSRWRFVKFEQEGVPLETLKTLLIGPLEGADASRGQMLVKQLGCVLCHTLPDSTTTNGVGPDLTYAGAMHRAEYLLESIQDPNAVIVPAPGYFDPKTNTSTMPSFGDQIPEQDYHDMAEYLRTLQ